ncbi:unnamed protein product [Caenorhabditis sp. 36 PRJEB53466]|nr:unnamed protein product [Caenorhabditis sp. 36 PRJEB53466]
MRSYFLLFLCYSISHAQDQGTIKFTVSLKEQKSKDDGSDQKYVLLTSSLKCDHNKCDYSLTVGNYAQGFFKVLVSNQECPNSICSGSFDKDESANVTVTKILSDQNNWLDIFDFKYEDSPKIAVLGCDSGLYTDGSCTRITETGENAGTSFWDEVCVCSTSQQPYCDDQSASGTCSSGTPGWWQTAGDSKSTTMMTSTKGSTYSSSSPGTTVTINPKDKHDSTFILSESSADNDVLIKISTNVDCDEELCKYTISVLKEAADGYIVWINNTECGDLCSGGVEKGTRLHVLIKRLGQHLDIFTLDYVETPMYTVLGCQSGLSEQNKCVRLVGNAEVDDVPYKDQLCSCLETQASTCDDSVELGKCADGGDVTWWIEDGASSSTSSTSSSELTSSGTTFPPQNPNIFDLSFMLSEGETNPNPAYPPNNVTITAFMNCTTTGCRYNVEIVDYAQVYFTINVDNEEGGEVLDLFDLQFIDAPNVAVLGCSTGMLSYEHCLMANYYDTVVQKDDWLCACQNKDVYCDANSVYGECADGKPMWWKTPGLTTSATQSTTLTPDFPLNIKLTETDANDQSIQYSITADIFLVCEDMGCTFQVNITNPAGEFYTVLMNDKTVPNNVESSFTPTETIKWNVHRQGEYLEWFELQYNNVVVLGCSSGYVTAGKCFKVQQFDEEHNRYDLVCTCDSSNDGCQGADPDGVCYNGTPEWWKPDSPLYLSFPVTLSEGKTNQDTDQDTVTVTASMNCSLMVCHYEAVIVNDSPTYYTVLVDNQECASPCQGTVTQGQPASVTVYRLGQHLELLQFQYETTPKIIVIGCDGMVKDGTLARRTDANDDVCLHIPNTNYANGGYYNDDVCVCQSVGNSCNAQTSIGKCSDGYLTWWVDDDSTFSSSPSTTSLSTSTPGTTTQYDQPNQFEYKVSLNEKKEEVDTKELQVSASMVCSLEECSYSITIKNSAKEYFEVLVSNALCAEDQCDGSFVKGKSVNVTVYRGNQHLDLFDFEYTHIPRIVVLGCDDGLADFSKCVKTTESLNIGNDAYTDEVCSCRRTQLDCQGAQDGVCRAGYTKWWEDNDESTSTSTSEGTSPTPTATTTTTIISTTPEGIPSLKDLSNSGVGLNNVTSILNDTLHYSTQGIRLNGTQVFEITKILHKSANLAGISAENAVQILKNMDECLNAHENEIRKGQNDKEYRLLDILRPMVRNTDEKTKVIHYLNGQNLGFGAKKVDCSNADAEEGLVDYGPDAGFAFLNDTSQLSGTQHNSVTIPLKTVCGDQKVTHVIYTIYRHQKLFIGPQKYRVFGADNDVPDEEDSVQDEHVRSRRDIANSVPMSPLSKCTPQISIPDQSGAMSATVMNNEKIVSRLSTAAESPIIAKVQFNIQKIQRPLHGKVIVSWFDTESQMWATEEQCKVQSYENGIVTATCAHLTDFSALVSGQLDSPNVCSLPLIIVMYTVNGLSMACLVFLVTVSILFYFRNPRIRRVITFLRGQFPPHGDIINLLHNSNFLLFFILTLFFMDQSENQRNIGTTSPKCVCIAATSYFSLICATVLNMLIGIRMVSHFLHPTLQKFFKVLVSTPAALAIGVIFPFTLTLSLVIFNENFFRRDDSYCWIRPDYVTFAVIIPILLPTITGALCSILAIYKIFYQSKRSLANSDTAHHDVEFWSKVIGLIFMQVAMGVPWGVDFVIIGLAGDTSWNYIFVILLGSQGLDLFIIFIRLGPALFCLIVLFGAAETTTYTFSFKETNLNNFLQVYYVNVQVDVAYSDDETATFTTTVLNVTPLHFSMFVNGRNCGIISSLCKFKIQK